MMGRHHPHPVPRPSSSNRISLRFCCPDLLSLSLLLFFLRLPGPGSCMCSRFFFRTTPSVYFASSSSSSPFAIAASFARSPSSKKTFVLCRSDNPRLPSSSFLAEIQVRERRKRVNHLQGSWGKGRGRGSAARNSLQCADEAPTQRQPLLPSLPFSLSLSDKPGANFPLISRPTHLIQTHISQQGRRSSPTKQISIPPSARTHTHSFLFFPSLLRLERV